MNKLKDVTKKNFFGFFGSFFASTHLMKQPHEKKVSVYDTTRVQFCNRHFPLCKIIFGLYFRIREDPRVNLRRSKLTCTKSRHFIASHSHMNIITTQERAYFLKFYLCETYLIANLVAQDFNITIANTFLFFRKKTTATHVATLCDSWFDSVRLMVRAGSTLSNLFDS